MCVLAVKTLSSTVWFEKQLANTTMIYNSRVSPNCISAWMHKAARRSQSHSRPEHKDNQVFLLRGVLLWAHFQVGKCPPTQSGTHSYCHMFACQYFTKLHHCCCGADVFRSQSTVRRSLRLGNRSLCEGKLHIHRRSIVPPCSLLFGKQKPVDCCVTSGHVNVKHPWKNGFLTVCRAVRFWFQPSWAKHLHSAMDEQRWAMSSLCDLNINKPTKCHAE